MIQTELTADARTLADLLIACPVEGIVTLSQASQVIGRDITKCRHVLASARRVALREQGVVFTTERSSGLRRISAERATEVIGPVARRHIRKTAGRAKKALIAATNGSNDLTPDAQRRRAAEISALGLMEHIARDTINRPANDAPTKPTPVGITAQALLQRITGAE